MKKTLLALGFVLTVLAGCATTTDDLIAQGDWYQVGYQDGVAGKFNRTLNELTRLGDADPNEYQRGYLSGVEAYCNPDFAYQIGLSGQEYLGVCEGTPQAQKFRLEFQRGQRDYKVSY